jgi:hypothetical protein
VGPAPVSSTRIFSLAVSGESSPFRQVSRGPAERARCGNARPNQELGHGDRRWPPEDKAWPQSPARAGSRRAPGCAGNAFGPRRSDHPTKAAPRPEPSKARRRPPHPRRERGSGGDPPKGQHEIPEHARPQTSRWGRPCPPKASRPMNAAKSNSRSGAPAMQPARIYRLAAGGGSPPAGLG